MITRAEFIGFSVLGPRQVNFTSYKVAGLKGGTDWKGWTASLEGGSLVLEGEGRRVEVPRARCVVYSSTEVAKATPSEPSHHGTFKAKAKP